LSQRTVQIEAPQSSDLVGLSNAISTTKYNLATFVPKFLFEQFRKYWNIYFLIIGCLQQIPDLSPTGRWGTIGPLMLVLFVTAVKEIWEDFQRLKQDRKINRHKVLVLKGKEWVRTMWLDLKVGDLVKVENREPFPADLVLLSSSEDQAMAYIETSNLDGETNLKVRQSLTASATLLGNSGRADKMSQLANAFVECEGPNKKLYDFAGSLTLQGKEPLEHFRAPLSTAQVLLRGSRLMNTDFAIGLVVYSGPQSKLMMNASKPPLKESSIQQVINVQIVYLFLLLITMSSISALCKNWERQGKGEANLWYIPTSAVDHIGWSLTTFIILYNNVIPISLQITLELVKVLQAGFVSWDKEMMYQNPFIKDDPGTWALARTSNLNEELGQIKYVFSDKTGTLTQNIMAFKFAGINGVKYSETDQDRLKEDTKKEPLIQHFMTTLSVCHTVIPEETEDKTVVYNASSPDEKAFVDAARDYGFTFISRTPESVKITDWNGDTVIYELLALIEFTSARKRMSVLVKSKEGKILLLSKGADSVIMARLADDQKGPKNKAQEMIDEFAREGLRTMALGMREVSQKEYDNWKGGWDAAGVLLKGRDEALDVAAVSLEKDLKLVGVTAIEDKLQDRVPETIANLLAAEIHVWVLTGDKQETAINIGRSCRMITPAMEPLITINGDVKAAREILKKQVEKLEINGTLGKDNEKAIIIDGRTMGLVFEDPEAKRLFAELGISCKTVICCRVSPSQKADVVTLIQEFTHGEVSLAIGDGANDVAMIQAARVGVGISGNEGLQAANSADFSIAQFSFLQRLLFVHGAWNYARVSKVLVYCFYKNITMFLIQMWFAAYNMWTGTTLFDPNVMLMYNVLFTFAQPFTLGLFDRKHSAEERMSNPKLYEFSQKGYGYNHDVFWRWLRQAVLQSAVLFFLPLVGMGIGVNNPSGHSEGFMELSITIYTCVVITVTAKATLEKDTVTPLCIFLLAGSVVAWFLVLSVYSYFWKFTGFTNPVCLDAIRILVTNPGYWFCIVAAPALCIALDVLIMSVGDIHAKYSNGQ